MPFSSKKKISQAEERDHREQYEYARKRVRQKKNLLRHFITFLAGAIIFIILDGFLNMWEDTLGQNWYIWAILIWFFILLLHALNVFVLNKFMGKEWEDRQLERLKARQAEKIAALQKQVDLEISLDKNLKATPDPISTPAPTPRTDTDNNPLPPTEL